MLYHNNILMQQYNIVIIYKWDKIYLRVTKDIANGYILLSHVTDTVKLVYTFD